MPRAESGDAPGLTAAADDRAAWDTALPISSSGPALPRRAIAHTGFTGPSLWIDPEPDLYVIGLTTRVAGTAAAADMAAMRRSLHATTDTAWQAARRG